MLQVDCFLPGPGALELNLPMRFRVLRRVHALRSLGISGAGRVAETLFLSLCVAAGFKLLGVPRTQAWLRRWASLLKTRRLPEDPAIEIRLAKFAQRIVTRNAGVRGSCLSRSLTLWAVLLRRGVSTDLRVGFRRQAGVIEGHAWLEHLGVALNEQPDIVHTYCVSEEPSSFDARTIR